MISFFFVLLSFIVIVFSLIIDIEIFYNVKRFGLPKDPTAQKILNFFTTGTLILVGLNLAMLFLSFK